MQELIVRVEDTKAFFDRAREDARRIDGGDFTPTAPSLSFASMNLFVDALSGQRWALLSALREAGPSSIRALAKALGRDYRAVHSDVTRLLKVVLIEKNEAGKVLVPWSKITAEVWLDKAA
jgi:predicted transcriptional regulator